MQIYICIYNMCYWICICLMFIHVWIYSCKHNHAFKHFLLTFFYAFEKYIRIWIKTFLPFFLTWINNRYFVSIYFRLYSQFERLCTNGGNFSKEGCILLTGIQVLSSDIFPINSCYNPRYCINIDYPHNCL